MPIFSYAWSFTEKHKSLFPTQLMKTGFGLLLALVLLDSVSAQNPFYINYNTRDGLPSIEVYDIEVDDQGLIWLVTDRGLCTYNGYEFQTYTIEDGLSDNTLFKIFKDPQGRLWFTTLRGGLCYYENGTFHRYQWNALLEENLEGRLIYQLTWGENGQLYYLQSDRNRTIYTVLEEEEEIVKVEVEQLAQKYEPIQVDRFSFVSINGSFLPGDSIMGDFICQKINDDFFIFNTYSKQRRESGDAYIISTQPSMQAPIIRKIGTQLIIDAIFHDHLGHTWICTSRGLMKFEHSDLSQAPEIYFEDMVVTSLTMDLDQNYWISTLKNGIFKIPSFEIKTIRSDLNDLKSEMVSILSPMDNHLIFGTQNGKLQALDRKEYALRDITDYQQKGDARYTISFEHSIGQTAFVGNYLLQETPGGLKTDFLVNARGRYQLDNGMVLVLRPIRFVIAPDRSINPLTRDLYNGSTKYMNHRVLSVEQIDQTIWIGTLSGLFSIDDYQFDQIRYESIRDSVLHSRINAIKTDSRHHPWVATMGNGLIYLGEKGLQQFTTADGLNSNLLNNLFVDHDTCLWVVGNRGLNKLDLRWENGQYQLETS
ncbi:MAG: two-component regulator propeller domain-containing protein, partial [Bacteroidota bacterium]